MKTAVVYYSMSGNCESVARTVARTLGADTVRIEPEKAYPDSGFKKFFWGGKAALMSESPALKPYQFDATAYDLVIFGFPVWAGSPTPPIRSFINENADALKGKKFAAFACQSGSGAEKALAKLKAIPGIGSLEAELILVDPKDKPSPEKDKAIADFCAKLA